MSDLGVLGIDIGGSGIKTAPVNIETGEFLQEPEKVKTPDSARPEDLAQVIKDIAIRMSWTRPIGVGYPGIVRNGVAHMAAHVSEDCIGVNLQTLFGEYTGTEVHVINDADAAGLAEMRFGAGEKHNGNGGGVVLLLTFGTGIGSAVFLDGKLLPNTEFGHLQVEGQEAENQASAKVRRREDLSFEQWVPRVNRVLAEYEMLLSPDLIIFGGGVTENFDQFAGLLKTRAKLAPAKLRNNAGILGAALAAGLGGSLLSG